MIWGVPVTIPDTGTAVDTFFAIAEESIAILRKRDGTQMSEVAVAPCTPTRSEPSASEMNVEVGLDETQVFEPAGKKWKQDDVAKDMLT